MDNLFGDVFASSLQPGHALASPSGTWPRANLVDEGGKLVLMAAVPGLSERDLKLTLNQEVLTISGERKVEAPEGYSVHRRERANVTFTRSFALP